MPKFGRLIRILFVGAGIIAAGITAMAAYFARMLIIPPRRRLWATPADLGLAFEEVQFPACDGIRLSGWFIPAKQERGLKNGVPKLDAPGTGAATLVLVHNWPGNRLGAVAETSLANVPASSPVNLLRLAGALHGAGYQLLMFDLRNHGHSAASIPVTFGLHEADDLLGALDYLAGRQDVDDKNIGVIGFAMGANTILYSLPRTELIKAAVAVQPSSPTVFSRRYATSVLGPLGTLVLGLTELIYIAAGGVRLSAIEPVFTVMGAKNTPVLYIQGSGDPWGSVDNVAQMAAATPNATAPLLIDTDGHSGGYQYVVDNPEVIDSFFRQHIS